MFLRYGYHLRKVISWRETPYAAPPKVRAGVGRGAALIAGAINSAPLLSDFFGYFLVRRQESNTPFL